MTCTKLDPRVRASCTCADCSRDRSRRVDRRGRNVANLMKRGAAIAFGLMGMGHAIHDRTVFCSHNPYDEPGHPAGPRTCAGQNFWHAEAPNEPCWLCGATE